MKPKTIELKLKQWELSEIINSLYDWGYSRSNYNAERTQDLCELLDKKYEKRFPDKEPNGDK